MMDTSSREDRIALGALKLAGFIVVGVIMLLSFFSANHDATNSDVDPGVVWDRYDVTLDVRKDGTLHVTEAQDVTFDGTFSTGTVEIPMARIESIDNVAVTLEEGLPLANGTPLLDTTLDEPQGDLQRARRVEWDAYSREPGTYRARQEGDLFVIHYAFDPTTYWWETDATTSTRTLIVEYDAHGVIRDYPDAEEPWQQFHWMAISDEVTAIAPIRSASVTVNLPEAVDAADLVVAPAAADQAPARVTWTRAGMREGDAFDVQAAFPSITEATAPTWQPAADERDATIEARETRASAGRFMLVLAGIGIAVIGGLVLLTAWYRSIREPQVGLVHRTVPQPPGDVPGVLVGSLMDERVDPRDIAAGVLDLHHQGVITIREAVAGEPERYYLTLNRAVLVRPAWARAMVTSIFGDSPEGNATRGFSALRNLFGSDRSALQAAIDRTLVDDGYYEELPETSRRHWSWVTRGFAVAGIAIAIVILVWSRSWTPWAAIPVVLGGALWWFGRRLTPHVAMKTRKGAEAAAMWRAFQRHLEENRAFRSGRTLDDERVHMAPWLVAFGMEQGWVSEMNRPSWEAPARGVTPPQPTSWTWGQASEPSATRSSSSGTEARSVSGTPTLRPPAWRPSSIGWDPGRWGDLQSGSDRAASTLSSMSDGAFRMIGDMLEAIGSSSGGGGGGSSRSGSSRGRSSRSGGGRSRSSSGGGRRSFG